ncbi:DgyrCDS12499 [Dimorphilus gyrociliatus]|uniref:Succinate dehydrogenase assembly factor 3 n=1 Tax=Dimorphilus gyrociliatus TaxID=2664684 RepID=A0A7I8W7I5_9ANNE|nr:DgyrCDS12499 [Dimorphilus gyrociliatus]
MTSHVRQVRFLYKSILRLHKSLPEDLKYLGDKYVKEEFKLHKKAEKPQVDVFLKAWAIYARDLADQMKLKQKKVKPDIGKGFTEKSLEYLSDDQVVQLYQLFDEINAKKT